MSLVDWNAHQCKQSCTFPSYFVLSKLLGMTSVREKENENETEAKTICKLCQQSSLKPHKLQHWKGQTKEHRNPSYHYACQYVHVSSNYTVPPSPKNEFCTQFSPGPREQPRGFLGVEVPGICGRSLAGGMSSPECSAP